MNTEWCLIGAEQGAIAEAEAIVRDLERRLSRFNDDSSLQHLNRDRVARDPVLAEVMRAALLLRRWTGGAFDPAVGAAVVAAGYDRSFEQLRGVMNAAAPPGPGPIIHTDGDRVALEGAGLVDLGGIAKGFAVDRAAEVLGEVFLVDGGGDVRVGGPDSWPIGVADDRAVALVQSAVATSSTLVRRWSATSGPAHHIVCPATGLPSTGASRAVVVAPDATTADALATALIASLEPAARSLDACGAQALVYIDGWWMTPGMEAVLL